MYNCLTVYFGIDGWKVKEGKAKTSINKKKRKKKTRKKKGKRRENS